MQNQAVKGYLKFSLAVCVNEPYVILIKSQLV